MDIKAYKGKRSGTQAYLKEMGVLARFPLQKKADIEYDDGVDIIYYFKNLPPSRFAEMADYLLLAAAEECRRYEDEGAYFFASFDVKLNRTSKGRQQLGPIRTYTAAKHRDARVMVYGEQELGYDIPEGYKKPFLVNRIREILGIPDSPSPGTYTKKQKPYTVVSMTIAIRAGLNKFRQ